MRKVKTYLVVIGIVVAAFLVVYGLKLLSGLLINA